MQNRGPSVGEVEGGDGELHTCDSFNIHPIAPFKFSKGFVIYLGPYYVL